jgi:hypothetical protein
MNKDQYTRPLFSVQLLGSITFQQHRLISERNSFGFGVYALTSAPIAFNQQAAVFSIGYERWLTPNSGCEVSLRYTNIFFATPRRNLQVSLTRPNGQVLTASRNIAQRWLNTTWGTDIIWITRPFFETIPQFRVGIGGSVDLITSLASLDATTPGPAISLADTNWAILARGQYREQVYFGFAICSEYSVLSFDNSTDLKIRLQMYLQTAWLPRRDAIDFSGGLLIGTSFRLHW